jgi:hypothetical protein
LGDLTFKEKSDIIFSVQSGKSKSPEISMASYYLSLLNMGFKLELDDMDIRQLNMMIYMEQEYQRKAERNSRMK